MKVTPIKKKFGKYQPGEEFELPDKAAKLFIKVGKVQAVTASMGYQTRMMAAEPVTPAPVQYNRTAPLEDAPYGYKADGTPRKIAPPKPKAP